MSYKKEKTEKPKNPISKYSFFLPNQDPLKLLSIIQDIKDQGFWVFLHEVGGLINHIWLKKKDKTIMMAVTPSRIVRRLKKEKKYKLTNFFLVNSSNWETENNCAALEKKRNIFSVPGHCFLVWCDWSRRSAILKLTNTETIESF